MGLTEALGEMQPSGRGGLCTFAKLAEELDADTWALLESRLSDDRFRHVDIAEALTANGYPTTHATVSRHRRGKCRCGR